MKTYLKSKLKLFNIKEVYIIYKNKTKMNTILTTTGGTILSGNNNTSNWVYTYDDPRQEFLDIIAEVLGIKSYSDFSELSKEERDEYKKNLIKSLTREGTINDILKKLD